MDTRRESDRAIVKGSLRAIARVSGTGTLTLKTLDYIVRLESLIRDMYLKAWPYFRDEGTLGLVEYRMQKLGLMDEESWEDEQDVGT